MSDIIIPNSFAKRAISQSDQLLIAQIPNKQDKIVPSAVGNIQTLGSDGNTTDSGKIFNDLGTSASDVWSAEKTTQAISDSQLGWEFQSDWDASTNTPTLSNTPTFPTYRLGQYWTVAVAGTQFGTDWTVGDRIIVKKNGATGDLFLDHENINQSASEISFDNTNTNLTSTNAQDVIKEINDKITNIEDKNEIGRRIAKKYSTELYDVGAFVDAIPDADYTFVATEAELITAMAVFDFKIKLTTDITLTAQLNTPQAGVLNLNGFIIKSATVTNPINITKAVILCNSGLEHEKPTDTSVECLVKINTVANERAVLLNMTIKHLEFGVDLSGCWALQNVHFSYNTDFGTATDSHRHIAIKSILGDCYVDNVTFDGIAQVGATRYTNFILAGITAWTGILHIRNVKQSAVGALRQLINFEALGANVTAGKLVIQDCKFDDLNGGIFFLTAGVLNKFEYIVLVNNEQGASATGIFKGLLYFASTGALGTKCKIIHYNNKTLAGALRADYTSLVPVADTENIGIIARQNTATINVGQEYPVADKGIADDFYTEFYRKDQIDGALDLKQNITDASLTTTSKEIVSAINENQASITVLENTKEENTLFVENTYGNDLNDGLRQETAFKTIVKAWTDINANGQIKIKGAGIYEINPLYNFSATTGIKTILDEGAEISGAFNLVDGNTEMEFINGKISATIEDLSDGTFYTRGVNLEGANLTFSGGGYKLISNSISAPSITLTDLPAGTTGTLVLQNIDNDVIINIGENWTVIKSNTNIVIIAQSPNARIEDINNITIRSVLTTQQDLFDLVGIPDNTADGYYIINFTPPPGIILNASQGCIIKKIGGIQFVSHNHLEAPSTVNVVNGVNIDTWQKSNGLYVNVATALEVINTKADIESPEFTGTPTAPTAAEGTNTTQLATTEFTTRATNTVLNSSARNPIYATSLDTLILRTTDDSNLPLKQGQVAYVGEGLISQPYTLRGTDPSAKTSWLPSTSSMALSERPTAYGVITGGQSNTDTYAIEFNPAIHLNSNRVFQFQSRSINNRETFTFTATADGSNILTLANTGAWNNLMRKGAYIEGTGVPANARITNTAVGDNYTKIQLDGNVTAGTKTFTVLKLTGIPTVIGKQLGGWRSGGANNTGIGALFANQLDKALSKNANDVVVVIPVFNGSTGFANNGQWAVNNGVPNALPAEVVRNYNAAKEYYEERGYNFEFRLMTWCQGEEDARQGTTQANYQTQFTNMFNYLKANCLNTGDIQATPSLLIYGLHSWWRDSSIGYNRNEVITPAAKNTIDGALRNLPSVIEGAVYIPVNTTAGDYNSFTDPIHINAAAAQKVAINTQTYISIADENKLSAPLTSPKEFTVNGNQAIGAVAGWRATFGKTYRVRWKYSTEDETSWRESGIIVGGSYYIAANATTTDGSVKIDAQVRARASGAVDATESAWSPTVAEVPLIPSLLDNMTVNSFAEIEDENNVLITPQRYTISKKVLGFDNTNKVINNVESGADHIHGWKNEVQEGEDWVTLIHGTNGAFYVDTTIQPNSNVITVAANTNMRVGQFVWLEAANRYNIIPRDTRITAINGTVITISNTLPGTVQANTLTRACFCNTPFVNQGGAALSQTGGATAGTPILSKIKNNANQWIRAINARNENCGLLNMKTLSGNSSYTISVLFFHQSYNNLRAVPGSNLPPINGIYGGNVAIDTGSRNITSRILFQVLTQLSTLWRRSDLKMQANHNTIDIGLVDNTNIVVNKWYFYSVRFDRATNTISMYRNKTFIGNFINTATLSAFMNTIFAIDLSNGYRAGAVGGNIAYMGAHKRVLVQDEIFTLTDFIAEQFKITIN